MRILGNIISLMALLIGAYLGWSFWEFRFMPAAPNQPTQRMVVDVSPQSTLKSVRNDLKAKGINSNSLIFKVWTKWQGDKANKLHIGEFEIDNQWSAEDIFSHILNGQPITYKVTHPEGQNLWDLEKNLAQKLPFVENNWWPLFTSGDLVRRMEIPDNDKGAELTLEGYLFPETYSFQKYDSPRKMIETMLTQWEKQILPLLKQHEWGSTPQGRHRLLTLASVIEKETGDAAEQPLIASVFWNRLKKKMKLQSDPTTIYALFPDFNGNLRKIHLTTPSPYNTYTLPELPVGPICNPGVGAIKALLKPATSNYIFFVSKGDGTHAFSADLKTHNNYVNQYQRR